MLSATKKRARPSTGFVAIVAMAVALAAAVSVWYQLARYEDGLLEIFATQQDQYVELAVGQIVREPGRDDEDIVDKVLGSITGSASQYWTLSKGNSLVFVKDVDASGRYRGFSSKTYYSTPSASAFISGLSEGVVDHAIIQIDGSAYIASGTVFSYGKTTYRLCFLTGKQVVIDQNAYLAARVNVGVTIAVLLVLSVITCVGMSLRNDAVCRRAAAVERDNRELRCTVERLNDDLMGRTPFDTAHSLFALSQAPVLIEKLGPAGELPATLVSFALESSLARDAFLARAQGVLDRSVVRFAKEGVLLLVFIGAEQQAAEYALSLVSDCPQALGTHVQREGEELAWSDLSRKLGVGDDTTVQ